MAAAGVGQLRGNRGEDGFDLFAQGNQYRDGDDGNKGEDESIFHESLASFIF